MTRHAPGAVALRQRQNGAALGRQRILDALADGPHGLAYLGEVCHMSRTTLHQRLRELADVVVVKHQPKGESMAGLRVQA